MDYLALVKPDWKKITKIKQESKIFELLSSLHGDDDSISGDDIANVLEMTPEDVALFLIRNVSGLKYRFAEILHLCGRLQVANAVESVLLARKVNNISEAGAEDAFKFLEKEIIPKTKATFAELSDKELFDAETDPLVFVHTVIRDTDKEIHENLGMCLEAINNFRTFAALQIEKRKITTGSDSMEAWENLDWPSLFHVMNTRFDPVVIAMITDMIEETGLVKQVFDHISKAHSLAYNNSRVVSASTRSEIEQSVVQALGILEPYGLEEHRTRSGDEQASPFDVFGFCN